MLYALISPAKRLDFAPVPSVEATRPALLKHTALLAKRAKDLSRAQIGRLMEISPKLVELNYERFQAFDPANRKGTKAAMYAFAGDVYMGLQAKSLSPDAVAFAQDHLGILSGLYGVLRPLDAIQPYRLEMGTDLDTERGDDLYAFWRDTVTLQINSHLATLKDPVVVNLASEEYWNVVAPEKLKAPVVQAMFNEIKRGKMTFVSFFAKKARGLMARAIIDNRWQSPEDIQAFDTAGYQFQPKLSDEHTLVFARKAK